MANKVVLLVVEGSTDKDSLETIFENWYDKRNDRVKVVVTRGDITSKEYESYPNVSDALYKHISEAIQKDQRYRLGDIEEIIMITDTDGMYVSDDCIVEDETLMPNETMYFEDQIRNLSRQNIIHRNHAKRENTERLLTLCSMGLQKKSFTIYYMSSNLEHVLHNQINCTQKEKKELADAFADQYEEDQAGFLHFICESEFSVQKDFDESWAFIKEGLNSLHRYSNLGLCFKVKE